MRAVISLGALVCWAMVLTAAQDRIPGPVAGGRMVVLPNSVNPSARRATDMGRMEPTAHITGITLMLAPSDAQAAELERFLEAQRDPASPDYQNWLTPEQYGDRFGLSENDFGMVRSWIEASGFAIEGEARARNWILFSGTVADIGQAFHVELHRLDLNGEAHFANTAEIQIPAALAGIVAGVRGFDDFRPKPLHTGITARPDMDAAGGVHYLAPADLATIYDIQNLYNAGYDGTGQTLAIAGQSDVSLSDLRAFRTQFSLPAKDPQLVLAGSDPGLSPGDQTEATLDLEWSGAVAKNAVIVYV
jgi:subtilase family serine protease